MQTQPTLSVLVEIFSLHSDNLPVTRPTLQRRLRCSESILARHLRALERNGLIDASRLRLTLPGLAVAVSSKARRAQSTGVAA